MLLLTAVDGGSFYWLIKNTVFSPDVLPALVIIRTQGKSTSLRLDRRIKIV